MNKPSYVLFNSPFSTASFMPATVRWLLPVAALLTLAGYFGPWVNHRVAGLVITGLDLGEYVKFLPPIRSGELTVWRVGFYWPLLTVSLSQSLYLFNATLRYSWWLRLVMVGIAIIAAFNMLPPAWTPARLVTPEFYQQSGAILLALAAVALSPFLALLPQRLTGLLVLVGCVLAIGLPTRDFLRILPAIGELYNHTLYPGWGLYLCNVGLALLAAGACMASFLRHE